MGLGLVPNRIGEGMDFRRVDAGEFDWDGLQELDGWSFPHTRGWLEFASGSSSGEPVYAVLESKGEAQGYFIGSIVRRFGLRVMASPGLGWTTPYVGLVLADGCSRVKALTALVDFAFGECNCSHLEIVDPRFSAEDGARCGFEVSPELHHVTDLTGTPEELERRLSKSVRRYSRHALRYGLVVEEGNPEGFPEEFSAQASEVFERQELEPPTTYSRENVQRLIDTCYSSGNLLLLRVRGPDGACVATAVSIGANQLSYGWGTASHTEARHLRPNELLFMHELKAWQARGARVFDWGPVWNYKVKYGADEVPRWRLHRSKAHWLRIGRELARTARDMRIERKFGVGAQGPAAPWRRDHSRNGQ